MFLVERYHKSSCEPWELLPVTASLTLHPGTAMVLDTSSGLLKKAGPTERPQYICMREGPTKANDMLPVERVRSETVYQTELSAPSASIKRGKRYTLAADAERITATDTSGVAEVVAFDPEKLQIGDKVLVRFPETAAV